MKVSEAPDPQEVKPAKNTVCLWYDGDAEEAARFYTTTFPDSSVGAMHRAPGDFPSGKKGDVLTVGFTVMGEPCLGLNGGPAFRHNEAFSFQVATVDQCHSGLPFGTDLFASNKSVRFVVLVASANEQNLERLAAEVERGSSAT